MPTNKQVKRLIEANRNFWFLGISFMSLISTIWAYAIIKNQIHTLLSFSLGCTIIFLVIASYRILKK